MGFETLFNDGINFLNGLLWGKILIALLIGTGIWFSFKTKFVQFRQVPEMIRLLGDGVGASTKNNHISSFQAFCVSTASRVGVGNIAGVAIAIVLGGPGSIFWMWLIALLGSATGFVESTLGQIYKQPLEGGGFHGGPAYYIKNGLKSPFFAVVFAVLISITFGLCFNSVQANTIAASLAVFSIKPMYTAIGLTAISAFVLFGGSERIAKVSEWLVPIMATVYILTSIIIVCMNIGNLPHVFTMIFDGAFNPQAFGGGFMGAAMMNGIKRGLFSNEAGMGSVPNAASSADAQHPVKQGLIQALGVFVDTLIVCSSTAFIVLIAGDYTASGLTGVALVQANLASQLGPWAPSMMAVFIFMFAFSSIIGNYYYSEVNVAQITSSKKWLFVYRLCVLALVFIGAVAELKLVWNLADLFMALMALVNIGAIILLGKQAFIALDDYIAQKKQGIKEPVFKASILPKRDGIVWWK